jgi:rare lipoprotein A
VLLAQAEEVAAREQAAAALAELAAQRAALDAVSASVTVILTPAQTRRSRLAAENQAPVLAAVEAAGTGYPAGYRPSGVAFSGTASWYGPGFVGNPTASGAPYDPERLTCANKEVPLGTVLRVSANGRAVSCLVNDRGPYVGDRVLDMSRAGSRALGYDGLASVTVEVLAAG